MLLLLTPTAAHAQQDAIDAFFSGTSWLLTSDELVLPDSLIIQFAEDDDGQPVVLDHIGNFSFAPQFTTTRSGKTQMSVTIGYEKGEIALVCPLPEADAEEVACECTQAGNTVPCMMAFPNNNNLDP